MNSREKYLQRVTEIVALIRPILEDNEASLHLTEDVFREIKRILRTEAVL